MARTSKSEQEQFQQRLKYLHCEAQEGVAENRRALENAQRTVRDLESYVLFYRSRKTGKVVARDERHEDKHPGLAELYCGHCSNIRSWRARVARAELVLPLAEAVEAHVLAQAECKTQAALWAWVQAEYPRVVRELVRELWHRARPKAAQEVA